MNSPAHARGRLVGATQTMWVLRIGVTVLIGFLTSSLGFVRLAETRRRDRLFYVAIVVEVLAFAIAAVTGGAMLSGMIVMTVLYNVSNQFAGEADYKVWSQEAFPEALRGTAQGLTYGVCRFLFALDAPSSPRPCSPAARACCSGRSPRPWAWPAPSVSG